MKWNDFGKNKIKRAYTIAEIFAQSEIFLDAKLWNILQFSSFLGQIISLIIVRASTGS